MASGTINGSTNNQYMAVRITWSSSTNVAGNYSNVTMHLQYRRTNGYTTHGTVAGYININGQTGNYSKSVSIGSGWVDVASGTIHVNHNSDGTKKCYIGASGGISGTSFTFTSCGKVVALDTIPRVSGMALSASSVDAGVAFTATISPHSGSFSHWIDITGVGDQITYEVAAGVKTCTCVVPRDRVAKWSNATAATATVWVNTKTGAGHDTKIGVVSKTIQITTPADIVPSTGAIAIADRKNAGTNLYGDANLYAADFSVLTVTIPAAAYSGDFADTATIKSITTTYAGKTYTGSPVTLTPTAAGTSDMVVTVTDSRGRTATTTKTLTVRAYSPPTIHVTALRYADAAGQTSDDTGSYAKVTITGTLDTAGVTGNSGTVTLSWQDIDQAEAVQTKTYTVTDGTWTLSQMIAASDTKAYTITASIADKGSTHQAAMILSNGDVPVDFLAGGKGVCFGATATREGFGIEMAPMYGKALLDYVHPIGSYYISDNATSPAEIFGGTWESITAKDFAEFQVTTMLISGLKSNNGKTISPQSPGDNWEFITHLATYTSGFISASYINSPNNLNGQLWVLNPPNDTVGVWVPTLWGKRNQNYMWKRIA
jgi:hypothetical protein